MNNESVEAGRVCVACGHEERFSDNDGGICEAITDPLSPADFFTNPPTEPVRCGHYCVFEESCSGCGHIRAGKKSRDMCMYPFIEGGPCTHRCTFSPVVSASVSPAEAKLPIGTRVKFPRDVDSFANEEHPYLIYAYADEEGEIVGHNNWRHEGYMVKADNWPHPFGISPTEFTPLSDAAPAYEWELSGETCKKCGGFVAKTAATYWQASNVLWNQVYGTSVGIRCIPCFTQDAKAVGITVYWQALVEPEPLDIGAFLDAAAKRYWPHTSVWHPDSKVTVTAKHLRDLEDRAKGAEYNEGCVIADLQSAEDRIKELETAINKTLEETGHLADGENCTLIDLKRVMPEIL